jgi:hypothetical protein
MIKMYNLAQALTISLIFFLLLRAIRLFAISFIKYENAFIYN